MTQKCLSSINFSVDDIAKIIQNLDPNKAHDHNQIRIRMLKTWSSSICRALIVLSNCGKIFEKLIFHEMFKFFMENDLISSNRSGFKPGNSCIYQFLSIAHEIYKSSGQRCFSWYLKSFWHGLAWQCHVYVRTKWCIWKSNWYFTVHFRQPKTKGSVKLASLFLDQCYNTSSQRSIPGPLLFLIYINDLSTDHSCNVKLFADTSLVPVIHNSNTLKVN